MLSKEDILQEIRKTTKQNLGVPLGRGRFENETGIKPYDWGKYWARFGDAQREAGFTPNQLMSAYSEEFLINKMIGLMQKLGKFPTFGELRIEKNNDPGFPNSKSFFETKHQKQKLARKIIEFCSEKDRYDDIISFCLPITEESTLEKDIDKDNSVYEVGEVYLFKSGRYYKIGKTIDAVRRGAEIRIQLPEKMDLIHSIKTDDPSGIEAYWHRRFELKRKNGEWFDLNPSDIKAFRRWRRIA